MARPYRSESRPSIRAIAASLSAALGAALLLALAWRWLGAYGEVVFVGTIARGLLIGALLTWVVRKTNFSRPLAVGIIAASATLFAIVGARYEAHTRHRAEGMADAAELRLISRGAGSDPEAAQELYRKTAESLTFVNYLRGYYGFEGQAKDGTAALWGAWAGLALYALEIAAAMVLATLYPVAQAREPACPHCLRWRVQSPLGGSAHGQSSALISHLLAGHTDAALKCLAPPDTDEATQLSIARCEGGHDEGKGGVLRICDIVFEGRNRNLVSRERGDLAIDQSEYDALLATLENWS